MHFFRPYFLLLIPCVIIYLIGLSRMQSVHASWKAICDRFLLDKLLAGEQSLATKIPYLLMGGVWIIMSIALSGPSFSRGPSNVYAAANTRVLALDLSSQMLQHDILPSRLMRIKFKLQNLLAQSKEFDMGLIAFSKQAFVAVPITNDPATLSNFLPELSPGIMPVQGSNIADALRLANTLIERQQIRQRAEIILISANPATQSDFDEAKKLANKNIKISVYAAMTVTDPAIKSLQKLAQINGGRFILLTNDDQDTKILLNPLTQTRLQATKEFTNTLLDQGYWFILPVLPLILLAFRKGWLEQW